MSITKNSNKFKARKHNFGGWFRFYSNVIDDHKIQRLPPHLIKTWLNLLCLAHQCGGVLPGREDIAFRLRMSIGDASSAIEELILAGLIDIRADEKLEPHNWTLRQWKHDKSAGRMRRLRERRKYPVTGGDDHSDASRDGAGDADVTAKVPYSVSVDTSTEGKKYPTCGPTVLACQDEGAVGRGDSDRQIHGKPTCSTKDGDRGTSARKVVRTAGGDA